MFIKLQFLIFRKHRALLQTSLNVDLAFNYGLTNEQFNLKTLCRVCFLYLMFIFHGLPHTAASDSGVIKAGSDDGTPRLSLL